MNRLRKPRMTGVLKDLGLQTSGEKAATQEPDWDPQLR